MKGKKSSNKTYKLIDPSKVVSASIDAGTRNTGVTLWSPGKEPGTFLLTSQEERRALIPLEASRLIIKFLKAHKVGLVVLEDFAYNQGGFFNTDQAEICGIVKAFCFHSKISYTCVPPNTVKKVITKNGKADKGEVTKAVKNLGYKGNTSHEFDSIGIGLTYQALWDSCSRAMYARSIIFESEEP